MSEQLQDIIKELGDPTVSSGMKAWAGKQEIENRDASYTEAAFTTMNTIGQRLVRPDLYDEGIGIEETRHFSSEGLYKSAKALDSSMTEGYDPYDPSQAPLDDSFDPNWDITKEDWRKDGFEAIMINKLMNEDRLNNHNQYLRERGKMKHMQLMQEEMSTHGTLSQLAVGLPIQLLDPINWPEFVLATHIGGWNAIARITAGAVAGGGTAYAQEAIIQDNANYKDEDAKRLMALFGAGMGGAVYGVFGRRNSFDLETGENTLKNKDGSVPVDGDTLEIDGHYTIKGKNKDGTPKVVVDRDAKYILFDKETNTWLPNIKEVKRGPVWFRSLMGRMLNSPSGLLRGIAARLDVSGIRVIKSIEDADLTDSVMYLKEVYGRTARSAVQNIHEQLDNWNKGKEVNISRKEWDSNVYRIASEYINKGQYGVKGEWEQYGKSVELFLGFRKYETELRKEVGKSVLPGSTVPRLWNYEKIDVTEDVVLEKAFKEALEEFQGGRATTRKEEFETLDPLLLQREQLQKTIAGTQDASVRKELEDNLEAIENQIKVDISDRLNTFTDAENIIKKDIDAHITSLIINEINQIIDKLGLKDALSEVTSRLKGLGLDLNDMLSYGVREGQVRPLKTLDMIREALGTIKIDGKPLKFKGELWANSEERVLLVKARAEVEKVVKNLEAKLGAQDIPLQTLRKKLDEATALTKAERAQFPSKSLATETKSLVKTLRKASGDAETRNADMEKHRSRRFKESSVLDYLEHDVQTIISHGIMQRSGRLATKKALGFDTEEELSAFIDEIRPQVIKENVEHVVGPRKSIDKTDKNYIGEKKYIAIKAKAIKRANKELDLYKRSVRLIWNTQLRSKKPEGFLHQFKIWSESQNFATLGGGIWATALQSEIAQVIARGGLGHALSATGKSVKEFKKLLKELPPDSNMYRQLQFLTGAFDVYNGGAAARFIDGELGRNTFTDWARTAAEGVNKYTFLSTITAGYRMALGSGVINDIFFNPKLLPGNISKHNANAYTRFQLDINRIGELQSYADPKKGVFKLGSKGEIIDMDLTKLPQDLQDMLDRTLFNASQLEILAGNKLHLPELFSDPDSLMYMMTQFLSYPMQAYESLLGRGVAEWDAKLITGITFSMGFSTVLALSKEELEVKIGLRENTDRKYSGRTDAWQNLALNAFNKGAYSSPMSMMANWFSGGVTGSRINSDFAQDHFMGALGGAPMGRLQDYYKSLVAINLNPFDLKGNAWNTNYGRTLMLNSFLPLYSFPVLGEYLRKMNKDMSMTDTGVNWQLPTLKDAFDNNIQS